MFGRDTDNSTDNNDQTHLAPASDNTAPAGTGHMGGFTGDSLNADAAQPASAPVVNDNPPADYIMTDVPGQQAATSAPVAADDDGAQASAMPASVEKVEETAPEAPAEPALDLPALGNSDDGPDDTSPTATVADPASYMPGGATHDAPSSTPADAPSDPTVNLTVGAPAPANDLPAGAPATASLPADLAGIKQQALQQLTPLVSHLDLEPLEKFRTTMMMLQATDDQALIKDVYTAAQSIPDEKTRAQALLDVVNEINYFSQKRA